MENETKKMRPIWFFVGIMLSVVGLIVLLTGVYYVLFPGNNATVLSELHPSLWWGGIMVVSGLIFLITNRNATVE